MSQDPFFPLTQKYLRDLAVLGEQVLEPGLPHVRRDVADVERVGRRRRQRRRGRVGRWGVERSHGCEDGRGLGRFEGEGGRARGGARKPNCSRKRRKRK